MLGKHPVTEIKAPLLPETVRAVKARGVPETAARVLQRIKAVFNYAIQTGKAADNPAFAFSGVIVREKVKHRPALPHEELTEFFRRLLLADTHQQNRICVLLIMLCFARNTEIRGGRWEEIDLDAKTWAIPAERMKRLRAHVIPLADWPLELLAELHTITGGSPFLFPSRTHSDGHISENTAGKIINGMGYKGIATPHGFRSLASSLLNEQGYNPDAIERQLAHVPKDKIRAAYNRAEYWPHRVEMMQWYSDYLRERYNAARALIDGKAPMQC